MFELFLNDGILTSMIKMFAFKPVFLHQIKPHVNFKLCSSHLLRVLLSRKAKYWSPFGHVEFGGVTSQ